MKFHTSRQILSFLITTVCVLCTLAGVAQQSSNAYLLEWNSSSTQSYKVTKLYLLTGFNKGGYNNQPFLDNNELYLSSSWKENDPGKTNIVALNPQQQTLRQVTNTTDAEYSPTVHNNNLYFVRLDKESSYQELWKYDDNKLQKVLPESNVAYFTPISSDRIAAVLIENNQLVLYDINLQNNHKKKIIANSGRSLAYEKGNGLLYFVHKYSAEYWYIKSYDLLTGRINIVSKTLPEAEDFYLENDRFIWMAKESRIYRITLQEGTSTSWDNIFNLEDYPLNNIGRLCVIGANQLVFINQ